jgi:putative aminopeptidase FrvX
MIKSSILLATAVALLGIAANARQAPEDSSGFTEYAIVPSVTGRESQFIDFLKSRLPAWAKPETDNMNNLIVRLGSANPDLLVVASIDEPGYVVSNITDDGFLRVQYPSGSPPSPLFHQFHEGHYVDILTMRGTLRGVVALPSSHIFRGTRGNLGLENFLIDIGARSRDDARASGVELLDPLTAVKDLASLSGDQLAGPMLSRKFPAYAMMEALNRLKPGQNTRVAFAWATQGYRRNTGVDRLAHTLSPSRVLVVGAFLRQTDRKSGAVIDPIEVLGRGVLLPDAGSAEGGTAFAQAASGAATRAGVRVTPSPTGAVPEVPAFEGGGAQVLPAAIPVRYPGTLVEVISRDDLDQLVRFIRMAAETRY